GLTVAVYQLVQYYLPSLNKPYHLKPWLHPYHGSQKQSFSLYPFAVCEYLFVIALCLSDQVHYMVRPSGLYPDLRPGHELHLSVVVPRLKVRSAFAWSMYPDPNLPDITLSAFTSVFPHSSIFILYL